MPYLKKNLPLNTPVQVEILERKGTVHGDYGPKVAYVMKFNGVVYDHEATATEESSGLALLQVGETVACKKVLNKYGKESIYWTAADGSEARGLQQNTGNTRQTAAGNEAKEYEKAKADEKAQEKEYWAKKDIGASLGMLVKIAMSKEADFDKALALAKEWRPKFQKAVEECYALDKYKAKEESPDTSVKPELNDAQKVFFGEDIGDGQLLAGEYGRPSSPTL